MGEWEDVRVRDLVAEGALLVSDGYRVRNEELGSAGTPFVRGGNIGDGWIDTDVADHVVADYHDRIIQKLSQPDDLAFITKGSVGRVGRLRPGQPTVVFAPQVSWWRVLDRSRLDPGYVFHLLRGPAFQASLYGVMTHGSMVADYVSISQQLDFVVRLPPIEVQRDVARILSALDEKIQSNRAFASTQRRIARNLFAFWLRTQDAAGAPRGDISAIANLNPESWPARGRPEVVRYVDLGVTSADRIDAVSEVRGGAVPSRAQRVLRPGDTIVGTVRPGNRAYALIREDGLTGSTGFAQLRPRNVRDAALVYLAATSDENIERLARLADGGAYPAVRPAVVAQAEIPMASIPALEWLSRHAQPLLDRAAVADSESDTLASIRDLLLPRLIDDTVGAGLPLGV